MVVFGGHALKSAEMLSIAQAVGLSETVFILDAQNGGDYRTRIFTVRREIPFAGHPSLASAFAFAETVRPEALELVQEDGQGFTRLSRPKLGVAWRLTMPAPQIFSSTERSADEIASMLGVVAVELCGREVVVVDAGVPWIVVQLEDVATLAKLRPNYSAIGLWAKASKAVGLVVFALSDESGVDAALRSFAPSEGIREDPVCGSCAGALAGLLWEGNQRTFHFSQDSGITRPGLMHVRADTDNQLTLWGRIQSV